MKHVTAIINWLFEVKEVRGMRVSKYGQPYSAIIRLIIVNGELSLDGLLFKANEKGTIADMREIEYFITEKLGFNEYSYIRYKNGKKTKKTKVIK